jgi:hypothetical protein
MQTRFRESVAKSEVGAKGSGLNVTDSSATALVEADWLISTGGCGFAANAEVTLPPTAARKIRPMTWEKLLSERHGRLVFIGWALHNRFLPSNLLVGKNDEVVPIGLVEGPPGQEPRLACTISFFAALESTN